MTVAVDDGAALPVISWAGPWLYRPALQAGDPTRVARVQVVVADAAADRDRALTLAKI